MLKRQNVRRVIQVGVCVASLLLGVRDGHGKQKKASSGRTGPCAASFQKAQALEQGGHLREAVKELEACAARPACGSIQQKCKQWQTKLELDVPSIVPLAKDETGAPVVEVTVAVDGEPLTDKLDGHGVKVDPGMREFTFKTDKGVVATQKIMIVQGQRNRQITVSIPKGALLDQLDTERAVARTEAAVPQAPPADDPPPRSTASKRSNLGPYLLGGLGLVGLTGYGLFTYWGKKDDDLLKAGCSPNCDQRSVDHVDKMYLIGKVSLGVGVAALGAAATWVIVRSFSSDKEVASRGSGYALDVQPTRAGALATVSGSF
jgi:hypothetical protein